MGLITDETKKVFDLALIKKGYLVYAKHRTWTEGKAGFVTAATGQQITVQYHPGIANVTNHFVLPVEEVAAGEWEIRCSKDMKQVEVYPKEEGEEGDIGGIASQVVPGE